MRYNALLNGYVLIEHEPGDEIASPGWWIGTNAKPGTIMTGDGPDALAHCVQLACERWPDLPIVILR